MLSSLIHSFLVERRASGFTAKTVAWHEASLTLFRLWVEETGNPTDPTRWTPTLLREYIIHLQSRTSKTGTPLSPSSVTSYTSSTLAFVRWLFHEEFIDKDIAAKVRKPRAPQEQKQPYSDADLKRLLEAAKQSKQGLRDYAMLCVLLDCGLRAAELTNLRTGDCLSDQNLLLVRFGKGGKDRAVPYSYETGKAIRRYLLRGRRASDSDYLFLSEKGGRLMPNSLLQLIGRVAGSAGVDGANVHRFRRSFAVGFIRNGGDSLILQRLMGHSTLQMVNTYVALANEDLLRSHHTASPLMNLHRR